MIKIVLDAMGSDGRPTPEVEAAVIASNEFNVEIILVGNENDLKDRLSKVDGDKSKIVIMHAPDSLDMSDHIKEARAKENNTMKVGMDIVASGNADAFVTAGNTGMAMYFAIKTFGLIKGLLRPCLCAVFPVRNGRCIVLDIGANAECRPDFLVQFAKMGSIYSQKVIGCKNPRIGLISNGEEEGKGDDLVRETYPLFKESIPGFIGNVEGKELFSGKVDVVVTDGFTGNVLLKSTEAVSKLIVEVLKENLMASLRTKIGAFLAKPAFNALKKMLDPNEIGAAPLLGIDGLVFVGHGRSNTKAMVSSILVAKQAIEANLLGSLRESIPNQVQ
ncbi:MAG: phosphate acyltransferase PlsX [Anaerolineaceae bacterium]|nr:phosphate acyltransferase PlsX [Anaerolineaceae bacterium]